jgi:hypothetical protein
MPAPLLRVFMMVIITLLLLQLVVILITIINTQSKLSQVRSFAGDKTIIRTAEQQVLI